MKEKNKQNISKIENVISNTTATYLAMVFIQIRNDCSQQQNYLH